MKKAVAILFISLVIVLLAMMIWDEKKQEKKTEEKTRIYQEKVTPLEEEKRKLTEKISGMKNQHVEMITGHGTVCLIFTDLDAIVFDEIWPDMQEHGMAGVLLISDGQFPGTDGNITMEQFQKMIESGWEYCLEWSEQEGNLESWLSKMKVKLEQNGLGFPETIYFSNGNYRQEENLILEKFAISGVVYPGEGSAPVVSDFEDSSVWCMTAYPFHVSGGRTYVEEAISSDEDCVFTIGKRTEDEMYYRKNLLDMLKQLDTWREKKGLQVMTAKAIRQYRYEQYEENRGKKEELEEEIKELNQQIEDLDKKIGEIYKKYYLNEEE